MVKWHILCLNGFLVYKKNVYITDFVIIAPIEIQGDLSSFYILKLLRSVKSNPRNGLEKFTNN